MSGSFGGAINTRKHEECAKAANRILYETVSKCTVDLEEETIIKNRCNISVIGYGEQVKSAFDGLFDTPWVTPEDLTTACLRVEKIKTQVDNGDGGLEEVESEYPVWFDPYAMGSTPMAKAFDLSYSLTSQWVKDHPDSFPPIVINITDGEPDDKQEAQTSASKLRSVKTSDGETLLFNIHISSNNAPEVILPSDVSELPPGDSYAQFLFHLSSPLPEKMLGRASMSGYSVRSGARGFVYNAKPETLIEVLEIGTQI
jgi:hypothetical protein